MRSDSSTPAPLRAAIIGYGLGGSVFHAPLLRATEGIELCAITTSRADRRADAEARYPGVRVVRDVEALWREVPALDLVVVTSPSGLHAAMAHDALSHGCHVVVDKPFAATAAEAHDIATHAQAVGRLAIPFQNRRWDGDFLTVRALAAHGTLGRIHRLESRFERWREEPRPRWREPGAREAAEGIVYDIGSHLADQALVLLGPVQEVYAELARVRESAQVEDEAFISLRHRGGARSHLYISAASSASGARFTLAGDRGAYVKHGLDGQEASLKAGADPRVHGWSAEDPERWGTVTIGAAARREQTLDGAYATFYPAVAAAMRGEAAPPVLAADAVALLQVIEGVFRSDASGQAVQLRDTA